MILNCDQAAAMAPDEEVLAFFTEVCRIAGANQESLHQESREIRKALDAAGKELAADLTGGDDFTVFWSDSGTGIFNLLNNCGFFKGRRILSSRLEHPALSAMLRAGGGEAAAGAGGHADDDLCSFYSIGGYGALRHGQGRHHQPP